MSADTQIITVIGGSGFLGRYVVRRLAEAGYRLRVVVRRPDAALWLKTSGNPGQISLISGDITRPESLQSALEGAYAVVNLTGILFEHGAQRFDVLHTEAPAALARLAAQMGLQRLIHASALGVDQAFGSRYARSKLLGEKAILAAFPQATILRPGVLFGAEDQFFNRFAALPFLPLIAGGKNRVQPVYVDDVAKAVVSCLAAPKSQGQSYELTGNTVYSMNMLLELVRRHTGKRTMLLPLSLPVARLVAFVAEALHACVPMSRAPLLTRDQLRLLGYDNVASPTSQGLGELGITPQPLELILPRILARYRRERGL